MASAQDIYDTLVKDPDFEVGEHQTREEAAQAEAEFRARQHLNNVKALSLANEPLKNSSSIKALLNYVSSMTKTVIEGSISVAQNILKVGEDVIFGSMDKIINDHKSHHFYKTFPEMEINWKKISPSGRKFFESLATTANMPESVLKNLWANISKIDGFYDKDHEDYDNWATSFVDELTTNPEYAKAIGIPPSANMSMHEAFSTNFPHSVAEPKAFRPESYKPDLTLFYGDNTKKDVTKVATITNVNAALKKMGFPHRVITGAGGKIKLATADGQSVEGEYHNPFSDKSAGRLYTSMTKGNAPTSPDDNITTSTISDFSIADILNSIHYLGQQPSPKEQEEYVAKKTQTQEDFNTASKNEEETLNTNPPTVPNQAGASPKAVKLSGEKAHNSPHVIMGAMFGPPTTGVGLAFGQALEFGLCDQKGRVNKIGQVLLQDAYKKGVLNNKHVFQTATHSVLKAPGILKLLEHHGIDLVNGKTMAKEVAENIAGQALAFEDMPEGIDWETLAKQVSGEIPVGGAKEIPSEIISDAESATGVSALPEPVGNPYEAYESKAEAHVLRLSSAMYSGNEDAINMAFGKIEDFLGTLAAPDSQITGLNTNNIHKLILDGIDPPNQAYFSDLANALDPDNPGVSDFQEAVKAGTIYFSAKPEPEPSSSYDVPDDAYSALHYGAKNLVDKHKHDYTAQGLSDDQIQAEKDQVSQEMRQAVKDLTEGLGGSKADKANVIMEAKTALADHLDTDSEGVEKWLEDNGITSFESETEVEKPSDEQLLKDISEKAQQYIDQKGVDTEGKALNTLHTAMKGAREFGLSAKEINDAVKKQIVDYSDVDLLDETVDAPQQPEQEYLDKYKKVYDEAKKFFAVNEQGNEGLSADEQIELIEKQEEANAEMEQAMLEFAEVAGVEKANNVGLAALGEHIGVDVDGVKNWLADNNISHVVHVSDLTGTIESLSEQSSDPKNVDKNHYSLQFHKGEIEEAAKKYNEISKEYTGLSEEEDFAALWDARDNLHEKMADADGVAAKEFINSWVINQVDSTKGLNLHTDDDGNVLMPKQEQVDAPTEPKAEAVPEDDAISALLDKNKDVIEHTYTQTYGTDNPVMSLEDFTEDLREKYSEMGEKKAKHEMAVAYKKQADFLAQKEQKETKAQEAADAKATATEEKQADQAAKDKEKAELQAQKDEEAVQAKAAKEAEAKKKAHEKDVAKNANSLPSEPGDLDQMANEMGDDDVGEPLATQHGRELMAHYKKYVNDMSPDAKKAILKAMEEAAEHGADFKTIADEMKEMGDDFGSPEHLQEVNEKAAQKAEFHQNHKELVSGTSTAAHKARAAAMAHGKHDKFTEFDKETGEPIKDEGAEEEPDAVKHHILHSLTPIQQNHVDEMKKAKSAGDEEGYKKAVQELEDSGVPIQDIEPSGDDVPKTGPPDPEVAKRKMADGYVWHEETRSWILKTTLDELKGLHTGGASGLVGGAYGGSQNKFDQQTGAPIDYQPFAVNEDETASTKNFFHNSDGHLIGLGDGKHTGRGSVTSSKLTQDAMAHQLNQSGHVDALHNSPNSYVPVGKGTPPPTPPPPPPSSVWGKLKAEYEAGKQKGAASHASGTQKGAASHASGTPFTAAMVNTPFLDSLKGAASHAKGLDSLKGTFFKEYPMPNETALKYFIKEYGTGDRLKAKNTIRGLVDRLEEENKKKSVESSIIT